MRKTISIAALAALLVFAVSVLTAVASPPAKQTSVTANEKQSLAAAHPTVTIPACVEQVIMNSELTAKVTGSKSALEAIGRFDFKIDEAVKTLAGHAGALEPVPIERDPAHPPVSDEEGSFY